jgi:hypothetical protein
MTCRGRSPILGPPRVCAQANGFLALGHFLKMPALRPCDPGTANFPDRDFLRSQRDFIRPVSALYVQVVISECAANNRQGVRNCYFSGFRTTHPSEDSFGGGTQDVRILRSPPRLPLRFL